MHKKCLAIVLLAMILGGCQDFKEKHPDFPKWGWWDKKEAPATKPAIVDPAPPTKTAKDKPAEKPIGLVETPEKTSEETPEKTSLTPAPKATPETQPAGPTPVKPAAIPEPPNHRSEVWTHVSKLRDMGNYPAEEQKKMITYAQENVQQWYKPMDVTSPDMNKSDWVIVMVWDFMPATDFQMAAANWKKIAEAEKVEFPQNLTRRKLMKFVRKMQDREPE